MAIMLGALYKALMEPTEENARKAAEEVYVALVATR